MRLHVIDDFLIRDDDALNFLMNSRNLKNIKFQLQNIRGYETLLQNQI